MSFAETLLDGLTPSQRKAVVHMEGPLLVLAGPGSGKTRVITRRIAHLLSQGVPAWSILAVTFTNKAAGEMKRRVEEILGEPVGPRGLTVTTFHSLCVRLLRRYGEMGGLAEKKLLPANFSIFDADDQAKLIKSVIAGLDLSTTNFPPRSVLAAISAAKNELMDDEAYANNAGDFYARTVARAYTAYQHGLRKAGAADFDDLLLLTARMLKESEIVRSEVQRRYRYLLVDEYQDTNKAQFVIASLIAGQKTPEHVPNICVVGDPDQSIYGWRGADIANILQFEERYPGATVVALGENFRSRAPILAVADRLIKNNRKRKAKPLTATRGSGADVEIVMCRDEHHESRLVLDWIQEQKGKKSGEGSDGEGAGENGGGYKDFAILYRTNALSRVMEDTLRNAGVPYQIVRGTAFYDREEIRNAIAYLRVIANPADSVSLERIVNTPARGISDATWQRLADAAGARGVDGAPVFEVLADVGTPGSGVKVEGLTARAVTATAKFVGLVGAWTRAANMTVGEAGGEETPSLSDLVERVIRESGLEAFYSKEEERLENLAELVSSAAEFEAQYVSEEARGDAEAEAALGGLEGIAGEEEEFTTEAQRHAEEEKGEVEEERGREEEGFGGLFGGMQEEEERQEGGEGAKKSGGAEGVRLIDVLRGYLERVSLVADTDALGEDGGGAVTLMTLHAAKGLEYPYVAMIGLEEGMLPHVRAQTSETELEEERRLCFVGITRAMEKLIITSARYRTVRGLSERTIPSRFLDELRGEHVRISDQADPMGGDEVARFIRGGGGSGEGRSRGEEGGGWGSASRSAVAGPSRREEPEFPPGTMVRHPQFGVGTVQAFSGGTDARVQVKFRDVGLKTLVLAYARLTRVVK